MKKTFLIFGGFSGAMAVALGAMAAHVLKTLMEKGLLDEDKFRAFKTAAEYQMYHSIALVFVALLSEKLGSKLIIRSGYCFIIGVVFFSGSLYLYTTGKFIGLSNVNWLVHVTPLGGMFFIAGWVMLGLAGLRYKKSGE